MARTVLTVQNLAAKAGVAIAFAAIDTLNGMQYRNTGREVVLVQTGTGSAVTLNVPSVADPFNRTGDLGGTVGASAVQAFGPFSPASIWGDGAANAFLTFSALASTASVAVISV